MFSFAYYDQMCFEILREYVEERVGESKSVGSERERRKERDGDNKKSI